ncbi:META domain-containing protein [Methanosarcina sp. T3]|uniref:META domain-containing protein n=1 Tax=Methanosarcina sp. T3 TaxID=3439062 RepID=UPI003F853E76
MKIASIGMILLLTMGSLALFSFSPGCTEQEETPAEPAENTIVEPTIEPAENTTQGLEPVYVENITGIEWQWTSFQSFDMTGNQLMIPDPENYTLAFFPDGTYHIKADCNTGSGNYTLEGNNLTIGPAAMTLMACGPDSMEAEYLPLLPRVETAALEDGQLVLYPGTEGDRMFFKNGGEVER